MASLRDKLNDMYRYQLTYEDFVSAHQLAVRSKQGKPVSFLFKYQFLLLVIPIAVLIILGAVVISVILIKSGMKPASDEVGRVAIDIVLATVPWLVITGLIWPTISSKITEESRKSLQKFYYALFGLLILTGVISALMESDEAPVPTAQPATLGSMLRPFFPMFVFGFFIWIYYKRYYTSAVKKAWDSQQNIQSNSELSWNDHSMNIISEFGSYSYYWKGLRFYKESDLCFLVYLSDISFIILPKRIFPSGPEIEQFRNLLDQRIGNLQARGYEVIPAQSPPPLPKTIELS